MKSKTQKGLTGLKAKWHKAVPADIERLKLPQPDHEYGYSWPFLEKSMSKAEYDKLSEWMNGQTQMLDDRLGPIAYTHDILRGIDLIRNGTPTYWD